MLTLSYYYTTEMVACAIAMLIETTQVLKIIPYNKNKEKSNIAQIRILYETH